MRPRGAIPAAIGGKKGGLEMRIKGRQWLELTVEQRVKLLEIAADQNWMGRWAKPMEEKQKAMAA